MHSMASDPTPTTARFAALVCRRGVLIAGLAFGVLHNSGGRNPAFAAWASLVSQRRAQCHVAAGWRLQWLGEPMRLSVRPSMHPRRVLVLAVGYCWLPMAAVLSQYTIHSTPAECRWAAPTAPCSWQQVR